MASITAHCIVKNEEVYVGYAIRSIIDMVDRVLVFDTGSTDQTSEIVASLVEEYGDKIHFEQKASVTKEQHTALRNEMIQKTETDWFMILDGDEVWTNRGIRELKNTIEQDTYDCLVAPFYLCVGDLEHASWRGKYQIRGKKMHATPRAFRVTPKIHWDGAYDNDRVLDNNGRAIFEGDRVRIIEERFWHMTHLVRSSNEEDVYSSGSVRQHKKVQTHTLIGKRIREPLPEVFGEEFVQANRLSFIASCKGFVMRLLKGKK